VSAMRQIRSKRKWVAKVVEMYERPLVAYARAKIGDVERAREVVQATFLKLWQADRARVEDHLAQWLYTVCRNGVIDLVRKERRMTPTDTSRLAELEHQGTSPGEAAERKQAIGKVLQAVETLPDKQKEVLRLRFQAGFSYREISEITGNSQSNVGFLIHTAIRSLRGELATASE